MNNATCRGCGASIVWIKTKSGKWMSLRQCNKKSYITTNADRIRAMSDEELAEFIPNWSYTNACKAGEHDYIGCDYQCEKCAAEWLKQPYTGKEKYM